MEKQRADLVIESATQVLTCSVDAKDRVGCLPGGWVAVSGDSIAAVGSREDVEAAVDLSSAERIDARGKVVAPGFVDCHTHVVFGGTRVEEYSARLETDDMEELRRRNVPMGIRVTLNSTRTLSEDELYEQSAARVREMILSGTTTLESKSGYGLDLKTEMTQLRVNRRLAENLPVDIASTFLGAHGWPADMTKERYMDILLEEMIPEVGASGLAEACDIWCDAGHYEADECRIILQAGRDAGMEPKIHTGAYSYVGGADLAADMDMMSADHLNYTPRSALKKLARARVPGVVLPGIDFAVAHPVPFDPRPMYEEGMELGLATNCCPGCWCTSMPFIVILACREHHMSPAMAIRAGTYGSAVALRRQDRIGSIEVGKQADLQIWNLGRYEDIAYRYGINPVETVIRRGKKTVSGGEILL